MKAKTNKLLLLLFLILILVIWLVMKLTWQNNVVLIFIVVWTLMGLALLIPWENSIRKNIKNSENPFQKAIYANSTDPATITMLSIMIPYIFLPYVLFIYYPRRRKAYKNVVCQNCQSNGSMKHKRKAQIIQQAVIGQDGVKRYSFICKNCEHQHFEDITYKYVAPSSSGSSSDSSWSGGSSSSSGGSWGGGSSGGGGASTKF